MPLSHQYSFSLFRAVSQMLCIGYGQIPQTLPEVGTVMFTMFGGQLMFAVFIGLASSIAKGNNSSRRLYKLKYNAVLQFMRHKRMDKRLRWKIADYYENRFQGKMFNEQHVLSEFNPLLRRILRNFNCKEMFLKVPFFKNLPSKVFDDLMSKLKLECFLYRDRIVQEDSRGTALFFIYRGMCRVQSRIYQLRKILKSGEHFGELCLLLPDIKRVANVDCISVTYIYRLTVDDFDTVMKKYPKERTLMLRGAQKHWEDKNKKILNKKQSSNLAEDMIDDLDIPIDGYSC